MILRNLDFYANTVVDQKTGDYQTFISDWSVWNKYFPYKLMILEANANGTYSSAVGLTVNEFILPIPPQELAISMPVASSLQPTLGGIIEQHNGAPFRDISLQGTVGVNQVKHQASPISPTATSVEIYGGLLAPRATDAVTQVAGSFQSLGNTLLNADKPSTTKTTDQDTIYNKSTGFYQFIALRSFIEYYVDLKKTNSIIKGVDTKNLRLALAVYKESSRYICTGVNFSFKRSSADPLAYDYSLTLRSFKRVNAVDGFLGVGDRSINYLPPFSRLKDLYNDFSLASTTLELTSLGISGLVGDAFGNLRNLSKSVGLFIKNASGIKITLSDMPKSIQSAALATAQDVPQNIKDAWNSIQNAFPAANKDAIGTGTNFSQKGSPLIGNKFDSLDSVLNQPINSFKLPISTKKIISDVIATNSKMTRDDFLEKRKAMEDSLYALSDLVGGNTATLAQTYGKAFNGVTKNISLSDFAAISSLSQMITTLSSLSVATGTQSKGALPSTLDYVAGLAQQSGIAFTVPVSKFAVPFPYGVTLERLALQYLGDANRWLEIATLNGLRAPYVDEEGWQKPFVTNGENNKVFVTNNENLFLNQGVYVTSNAQARQKRRIVGIQTIGAGLVEVTLSGDSNLDLFKVIDNAVLEGFLPGTVNSQQIIYIPSNTNIPDSGVFDSIPGVDQYDPLIQAAGVDLLLNDDGDLILTPDGDTRLAYGLQNIIQQVKLGLSTEKGTILQHPSYGVELRVGSSTANTNIEQLLKDAKSLFSDSDVFTGVTSATAEKNGPVVKITLVLGIKGLGSEIPITFNVG